jgi:transcriptional regulator with XRE-family HTH domain
MTTTKPKTPLSVGRGKDRPKDLDPAIAAVLDDAALRTANRRERLRQEALDAPQTPNTKSQLWERLRAARAYAQRTQRELAAELGVTRGAITLWESPDAGVRTMPRTEQLPGVADYLRVPLSYLMDDNVEAREVYNYAMHAERSQAKPLHWEMSAPVAPVIDPMEKIMAELARMRQPQDSGMSTQARELGAALDAEADTTRREALFKEVMQFLAFRRSVG